MFICAAFPLITIAFLHTNASLKLQFLQFLLTVYGAQLEPFYMPMFAFMPTCHDPVGGLWLHVSTRMRVSSVMFHAAVDGLQRCSYIFLHTGVWCKVQFVVSADGLPRAIAAFF